MKKWFFILGMLITSSLFARHIAGGELFYEYLGPGTSPNSSVYKLTLRLFRDCASTGPQLINESVDVGAYENNIYIKQVHLPLIGNVQTISLNTAAFPCLIGNVQVCYQMALYSNTIELPINAKGYTLSRTSCCRIDGIINIGTNTSGLGATYVTQIPGTDVLPVGFNSSPEFLVKDTALVCANRKFQLDFGATDQDGDSLSYAFCDAYNGVMTSSNSVPTSPYTVPLTYTNPYSGTMPLGANVSINTNTGLISGIAPGEGTYVVNVCITEWRDGKAISEHRKDFILKVQSCDIVGAQLPDKIINCDSLSVSFENGSTSSNITDYLWTFGDPHYPDSTSHNPTPTFTYADTGRFTVSLTVKGPKGCVGSDSTTVLVYPGFHPGFTYSGECYKAPFQFNDTTTTAYGVVDSWSWNFGDPNTLADTSHLKSTTYLYPSPFSTALPVTLIVTTSKGCIDTVTHAVLVDSNPKVNLAFTDTLICKVDTLPLLVYSTGVVSWSPNYNIINPNTNNPLVYPQDTTTYYVTVSNNGCTSTDSVKVNVLDSVTVEINPDTSVCKTDTFRLRPVSYALQYQWTASTGVPVAPVKYPLVQPLLNTIYYVTARLGKCYDTTSTRVNVFPYPISLAGADTTICFGSTVKLAGNIVGDTYSWTPVTTLLNPGTLTPTAGPARTTTYILTVRYNTGCVKPVSDSVTVNIVPIFKVSAGNDTSVVANQPLQLYAVTDSDSAMTSFVWTPPTGLDNPGVYNPVATLGDGIDSIEYHITVTDNHGCRAENDIWVVVFKTAPDIFVPSAFTPNGDGRNDIFKPVPVGISNFEFFRVYNRLGQLLFSTSEIGKGWDGTFAGTAQASGTYVYTTQGIDYTGKVIFRKGTVVLIR